MTYLTPTGGIETHRTVGAWGPQTEVDMLPITLMTINIQAMEKKL